MTRALLAAVVGLALLAGLVGWQLADARGALATAEAAVNAGHLREIAAVMRLDSLATAQRGRDRTTTRLLTRWDTVKAGVDTLLQTDTVTVTRDVLKTVLVTADSAVQACVLGRVTCEARVSAATERGDALAAQRDALTAALVATRRRGWWEKVGAVGVGAVAGLLLARR